MDLLITDTVVVTCDTQRRVIEHGAVALHGNRIAAVGATTELEQTFPYLLRFSGRGLAVLPGFINAHTHTVLTVLRGTVEDLDSNPVYGGELLAAQLARLDRKLDTSTAERRRLADLYQTGFIERDELLRRGKELDLRHRALEVQRQALLDQRGQLVRQNNLRDRIKGFADKVTTTIDQLDFDQRQQLLRLVVDQVRVAGWRVEIRFRIPLDHPLEPPGGGVSSKDRLRSLHRICRCNAALSSPVLPRSQPYRASFQQTRGVAAQSC